MLTSVFVPLSMVPSFLVTIPDNSLYSRILFTENRKELLKYFEQMHSVTKNDKIKQ